MVYTVTINPSLDYIATVDNFRVGMTNRTNSELILPGGKGINVSQVLKNLDVDNVALGFVAGFTGDELSKRLENMHIKTDFIKLTKGNTRINVKLRSNVETEINGQGPVISEEDIEILMRKLDDLTDGDIVVLAGSIPSGVTKELYKIIMERLSGKNVDVVVDATKELLTCVLPLRPFLIKPNNYELSEIFGTELKNREDVVPYAKKLKDMGARNVLVSLGGEGAVLVTEAGEVYAGKAPEGVLVNSVGAGDSMVAGFIAGFLESQSLEKAFCMGVAAGSASAFSEYLATKENIMDIYCQYNCEKLQNMI